MFILDRLAIMYYSKTIKVVYTESVATALPSPLKEIEKLNHY